MTPVAVLIGLPGTGKSTSGRRLAKILALPFLDSDDAVESAAGLGVRELFARDGEAAFRAAEAAAIASALREFDGVLALGGGALLSDVTRDAVQASGAPVVLLVAELDTLGARVGDAHTRPLLAGDPARRLADLATARAGLYEQVAQVRVDTDGRTPGQVAATIAARLHERSRVAR